MKRNSGRWSNCIGCHQYNRLDSNGRCQNCVEVDLKLIDIARKIFQHNPHITREEVADKLGVTLDRVDGWIRDRKVRCVTLKEKCPDCGRLVVNKFSCVNCGYNASPPPAPAGKPCNTKPVDHSSVRRVSYLQNRYWNHFSSIRKQQKRRLWLIPAKGELK